MLYQVVEGLQRKHFPLRSKEELLHILAAHAKSAAGDAGYDLEPALARGLSHHAQAGQVLHPRDFVPRRPIILRHFGFDDPRMLRRTMSASGILVTTARTCSGKRDEKPSVPRFSAS